MISNRKHKSWPCQIWLPIQILTHKSLSTLTPNPEHRRPSLIWVSLCDVLFFLQEQWYHSLKMVCNGWTNARNHTKCMQSCRNLTQSVWPWLDRFTSDKHVAMDSHLVEIMCSEGSDVCIDFSPTQTAEHKTISYSMSARNCSVSARILVWRQ